MSQSEYLTAGDVALLLQVDPKTVYRWAATDASFPACRPSSGVIRVRREALMSWLDSKTQKPRRRLTGAA